MDIVAIIQMDRFDHRPYDSDEPSFLTDKAYDNRGPRAAWALEAALGEPPNMFDDYWRADMSHVRSIDIRAPKGVWDRLENRIRFTAPLLQSIKLKLEPEGNTNTIKLDEEDVDYDTLIEGPIRQLHVDGIALPQWTSLARSLVHVKVTNASATLSGHLLYELLEHCTLLETLEVGPDCLYNHDLDLEDESEHPISMRYLHTLILGLTYRHCAALLGCITLPPACSVTIGSSEICLQDIDEADFIGPFVQSMCAGRFYTFTATNISDDFDHIELSVSTDDEASIVTTLIFPFSYDHEEQSGLTRRVLEAAANAHLRTIDIKCDSPLLDRDSLADVLHRSPNLQEIRSSWDQSAGNLFLDAMLWQGRTPILPQLRRVAFRWTDFPTGLGNLGTFLLRRIELGHKLPTLSLSKCEISESDIPRLRELVGELEWEPKKPLFSPGYLEKILGEQTRMAEVLDVPL
ncbi:hypothetical protein C8J57DRAFT_1317360 [Mycena rebaudengoi]|nr:hypothetical protein C8J57DRAFT_1317360 [Mycena rebaudengoi]